MFPRPVPQILQKKRKSTGASSPKRKRPKPKIEANHTGKLPPSPSKPSKKASQPNKDESGKKPLVSESISSRKQQNGTRLAVAESSRALTSPSHVDAFMQTDLSPSHVDAFMQTDLSPSHVDAFTQTDLSPSHVDAFTQTDLLPSIPPKEVQTISQVDSETRSLEHPSPTMAPLAAHPEASKTLFSR